MNGRLGVILLFLLLPTQTLAAEFAVEVFPARNAQERRYREARILEAAGDPAAVSIYQELLAAGFTPADAVRSRLGRLLPLAEAEAHWRAILSAEPESPFLIDALTALAESSLRQGHLAEAQSHLERIVRIAADQATRAATLAKLLPILDLQGLREATQRVACTLWVDYATQPQAKAAEGYLGAGDPLDGVTPEEALRRGLALLKGGSRQEAVRTLGGLRQRLPLDSPLRPEVELALGKAFYFLKRYVDAISVLEPVRSDVERGEEARFYLARSLFGLDRGEEGARELWALALERRQSARAPNYLQQASRVFEGRALRSRAARARQLLKKRYPRSAEATEGLWSEGWRAYGQGRYDEAVERLWGLKEVAGRDWLRAQALYWEGRALLGAGEPETAREALETLTSQFPLGYYGRLGKALLGGRDSRLVADARRAEARALPSRLPEASELDGPGRLGQAAAYLRLGLSEAARAVLLSSEGWDPGRARLLYWAEDFRGALRASALSWLNWPTEGTPSPLSREGLAYPLAYPASASVAAAEAGIHPHLLLAVAHTESHFNPRAYSWAEARGLMQFIPSTGAQVAKAADMTSFRLEDLYDPGVALRLGARHLRELLDRFEGDVVLAVAAYNAGAGAVSRWMGERGAADIATFVESIPYGETRQYVKKVLTALDAYGRLDPPGLWVEQSP